MSNIGSWDFCVMASQRITHLAGQAVYRAVGRRVLYELQLLCSEDGRLVRHPNDLEILEVIDKIKKEMMEDGGT